MSNFCKLFDIMSERKVSAYKLSKDTGISDGNISGWKNGRSSPNIKSIILLSKYFNVRADCLTNNERLEEKILIEKYMELNPEQKQQFLEYLKWRFK